ncbi:hypothetical protein BBK82_32305 [Lentzea guizhouensis]|uniref:ESX-1 secretion-associated protein n=1 Tax=Lentzea guizhouensis TaxID=1586287 RepID=A0A1B2HQN1_9PSEU|nr:type VII secretion target [Lentzea guizhouensis]ANZ40028.1 hypothetical protein BBK82_32305 [Lentzea guizhouensis]
MTFTVDHEQLRAHASTLAAGADKLAETRLPQELGQESLGQFAQFLTAGLGGAMNQTAQAFAHVASTMDKVGDGMRRTAEHYQRTDDTSAMSLGGVDA